MEFTDINISSYPSSEKIYIDGTLFPIKVGMRKINLTPTVKIENGEKKITPNAPVVVYDTSGAYTDKNIKTDINEGLPRLREQLIADRNDTVQLDSITSDYGKLRLQDKSLDGIRFKKQYKPRKAKPGKEITQMAYAKAGIITAEMEYVAIRENLNNKELGIDSYITPEFVRDEIAAGRFAPLGGALCRLRGGLGRFDGIPRAVPRFCGGVFLFNGLLLLPAGIGVGSPAVFLLVLFVQRLEIGFVCGGFRLVRFAVGLFRMGAVRRFRNAPGALRRLGQGVRRLRAGVVVALLPELAVDCAADGIQRRFPCGVRQLGGRTLFVRLLKEKARRDLAALTVHNALFDLYGFLGDFRFGLFQLNRRPVRLADSSFQLRQGTFFLGENQPWRAFCHIHHLLMGLLMG